MRSKTSTLCCSLDVMKTWAYLTKPLRLGMIAHGRQGFGLGHTHLYTLQTEIHSFHWNPHDQGSTSLQFWKHKLVPASPILWGHVNEFPRALRLTWDACLSNMKNKPIEKHHITVSIFFLYWALGMIKSGALGSTKITDTNRWIESLNITVVLFTTSSFDVTKVYQTNSCNTLQLQKTRKTADK